MDSRQILSNDKLVLLFKFIDIYQNGSITINNIQKFFNIEGKMNVSKWKMIFEI